MLFVALQICSCSCCMTRLRAAVSERSGVLVCLLVCLWAAELGGPPWGPTVLAAVGLPPCCSDCACSATLRKPRGISRGAVEAITTYQSMDPGEDWRNGPSVCTRWRVTVVASSRSFIKDAFHSMRALQLKIDLQAAPVVMAVHGGCEAAGVTQVWNASCQARQQSSASDPIALNFSTSMPQRIIQRCRASHT